MAVWSQLMTALGRGPQAADGAVIDAQTLRILDQEIREADAQLRRTKEALAAILAQEKHAEDDQASAASQISAYEGYAMKALEVGDEALALEVATKIAALEAVHAQAAAQVQRWAGQAKGLRQTVEKAQTQITRLKQQADTVKATQSVQSAQATLGGRGSGAPLGVRTALDSLARMQQTQSQQTQSQSAAPRIETVAGALGDTVADDAQALEARLRNAGIGTPAFQASAILARLKANTTAQAPTRHSP